MDYYCINFVVTNKDTNEIIFRSNCVMNEKNCNKFLKDQLNFINQLKDYSNLNIELTYNKCHH